MSKDIVIPEGSQLGTKEYWENHYKTELELFTENGDSGEVWFGTRRENQIIQYILKSYSSCQHKSFLDIGCGNGHFLYSIKKQIHANILYGLDYSESSLKLAEKFLQSKEVSASLFLYDLLQDFSLQSCPVIQYSIDIVVDKGTFDAISLLQDDSCSKNEKRSDVIQRVVPLYLGNVANFLCSNGILCIASCNWTLVELEHLFCSYMNSLFVLVEEIPIPTDDASHRKGTFSFGGVIGNSVTCAVFKKIAKL